MVRPAEPTTKPWTDVIPRLTRRHKQTVVLIVVRHCSYKAAARKMPHRYRRGETVAPDTVRQYANQVRDLMGTDLPLRSALAELYWTHPEAFEGAI